MNKIVEILSIDWTWIWTENLAVNKRAWQANPSPTYGDAHGAVDGSTSDLTLLGGKCAVSKIQGYKTAEWRVDLGDVFSIHHVLIQYMTESQIWGI